MSTPEASQRTVEVTCNRPGCGHGWLSHLNGGLCAANEWCGCSGFQWVDPAGPATSYATAPVRPAPGPSITCPDCDRTSWHPEDVATGYCGACHAVTSGQVTRPCLRCEGCGLVADTDEAEPWTAWTSLPLPSGLAVRLGLVHPVPCPSCHGRKRVPA